MLYLRTGSDEYYIWGFRGLFYEDVATATNTFGCLFLCAFQHWDVLTGEGKALWSSLVFHRCSPCLHGFISIRWADNRQIREDRKSTRLNSSHVAISYAVF